MRQSERRAYVSGTWSNLKTQVRAFFMFCTHFDITAVPASSDTVMLFAQFLSRSFSSPQSIKNYLNGVKFIHILLGHEFVHYKDAHFRMLFRGIERNLVHVPQRASPISIDILRRVGSFVDSHSELDLVCYTACLLLFFLMARAGNVFHSDKDSGRGLLRKDVYFSDQDMFIRFRRTKTIQFGRRVLVIPIRSNNSIICPVLACRRMIESIPGSRSQSLFLVRRGDTSVPLSKQAFLSHVRVLLSRAGVADPSAFSCHSFRRGGASFAFSVGIPGEMIQIFGDWASDCYKLYLEVSMNKKIQFADQIASCV